MTKNLKLHVKNVQIADAINLRGLKAKLSKKKASDEETSVEPTEVKTQVIETAVEAKKPAIRAKAKKEEEAHSAPEPVTEKAEVPIKAAVIPPSPKPEIVKEPPKVIMKVDERLGPVMRSTGKEVPTEKLSPPASERFSQGSSQDRPTYDRPQYDRSAPRQDRPSYDRPYQDRGQDSRGQDRPAYQPRSGTDRPAYDRPYQPRSNTDRPPYQPRSGTDRSPQDRPAYDRPYQPRSYTDRPPYQPRSGTDRPAYDRPPGGPPRTSGYGAPSGDRPPYRPRPPMGGGAPGGRPGYSGPGYSSEGRPPFRPQQGGYGSQDARRPAPFRPQPFARGQAPVGPKDATKALERGARTPEKKDVRHVSKDTRDATKPKVKVEPKGFDARMRHGFQAADEDETGWRKKRPSKSFRPIEQEIVRPTKVSVRLPISVKDLASEMKLKASELISKLFLQGVLMTLNDLLDDDTVVQLLGHEFGCEITIDTTEAERIRITDKTIKEEITGSNSDDLIIRSPVVAFMGHVDHGKTSLIDAIRKSNRVQHEVGAITQHIGAFKCHTKSGDITVLDTPGHEAFSNMRERGAEITDIVVLVVAGDEGMKAQTFEALQQAQSSNATIVVAINKCDKPNFDVETVYRQLAEKNLLPEAWGGQTITVSCSAVSGQGIPELLEMLALQAEVLELRANPKSRARGTVIESQMDKGLGPVTTVLVQNGTLRVGDALVFAHDWARVKTMRDQEGNEVKEAGPSMPVRINGLSGFPEAGEEFICVSSEREAREISTVRCEGRRQSSFQTKKRLSYEGMVEKAQDVIVKKVLNIILRGDVQGSVEALKNALLKIESNKIEVNIISSGVGLISESDVQRATSSKAVILGFHTQVESHLESLVKELGVQVHLHDIIYHAVDDIRALMTGLLDKIKQEKETGKAEVKALFKSSQLGLIAGCQVLEGSFSRNSHVRVKRGDQEIWKGSVASLKRNKDDVREVQKGVECGILLQGFTDFVEGDILESFEVIYLSQEL